MNSEQRKKLETIAASLTVLQKQLEDFDMKPLTSLVKIATDWQDEIETISDEVTVESVQDELINANEKISEIDQTKEEILELVESLHGQVEEVVEFINSAKGN